MQIPINRLKHCYMVGKVMEFCAKELKLNEEMQQEMFFIGYVHDSMYDFEKNETKHDEIVSNMLRETIFSKEVSLHSKYQNNYQSIALNLLYLADQIVDGYGNVVGFKKRIEDILNRHGKDDGVYKDTIEIVDYLKTKKELVELEKKCIKFFNK